MQPLSDHGRVRVDIQAERERQEAKWGEQNHDPFVWLAILMEEVGEVGKATVERDWREYRAELVQVAAVAEAMILSTDRNSGRDAVTLATRIDDGMPAKDGEQDG